MEKTRSLFGALALGLVLVWAGSALAQDWPQWRGQNRDGKAVGFKAPKQWPKELTLKWKETVGAGDATPALLGGKEDGKLYVFTRQGDEEGLACRSAADGKLIGRFDDAAMRPCGTGYEAAGRRADWASTPITRSSSSVVISSCRA